MGRVIGKYSLAVGEIFPPKQRFVLGAKQSFGKPAKNKKTTRQNNPLGLAGMSKMWKKIS